MNLPTRKPSKFDEPIDAVLHEMNANGPYYEKYDELLVQLERLIKLQSEERSSKISPDTLATVVGNLLGILTIVSYEQKHVMVSKAFGLFTRGKSTTP